MKIGIDISQIVYQGTGVATYTQKLVENLLRIDKKNEYVLFFSSLRRRLGVSLIRRLTGPKAEIKQFRLPPTLLDALWNRLHIMPPDRFVGEVDVFHSSDWTQPPTEAAKITTVHDLIVYKYSKSLHPKIVATQRRRLAWVKKECDLIIADSTSTKRDIIEILEIPEAKIRVIYLAPDERFKPQSKRAIANIKKKYKIKRDWILSVGTREPRKNLKRTIQAFKLIKDKDLNLVIAGKFGWGEELSTISHQPSAIKLLGYVPEEDLPALYAGAQVFVYPSLYEGFGLPILEAMASGCPVVTSNVSSLPEIAGKATVLVNPENVEDIARGIGKAIEKKNKLTKKGLAQARKFSWAKTAKETLKAYKEAYAHRH